MIVKCEFELVGIVLTYSKRFKVFRVDHVFKPDKPSRVTEYVMQKGRDTKLLIPFTGIVRRLADIYGPQLRVGWKRNATHIEQWYLQLRKVGSPGCIGLDGTWTRWIEG